MRHIDEDTITQAVIARHADAPDERLREIMTSLVQHLHAFAREVKLTEVEWAQGIDFLTRSGRICSDRRQEFVLLSDTLGLSMLVTGLNHRPPKGCTPPTVPTPLHAEGAPHVEHGADFGRGTRGEPCFVRGRVRALDGTPIAGAEVQVWQADAQGSDDTQHAGTNGLRARGTLTSDAGGCFHFRSMLAEPHPIPHDGPVGQMLAVLGRHPWRAAHLQFTITAPGCERLTTQVFRENGAYLDSDAAFGVRDPLVADWVRHAPGRTPDGGTSPVPFYTLDFDFVVDKASA